MIKIPEKYLEMYKNFKYPVSSFCDELLSQLIIEELETHNRYIGIRVKSEPYFDDKRIIISFDGAPIRHLTIKETEDLAKLLLQSVEIARNLENDL